MKREDILKIFPEASDEQVTSLLNQHGGEVNTVRGQLKTANETIESLKKGPTAEDLQKEKDRADNLQKELDSFKASDALRLLREKVASAKKIPVNLLNAETEEALNAQADAILAFAKPDGYPEIKDGGEPNGDGKPNANAAWATLASQITKN